MIFNPQTSGGGSGQQTASLSVSPSSGTGSRPKYWNLTFVDSNGVEHVGVSDGTFTVPMFAMISGGSPGNDAVAEGAESIIGTGFYKVTSTSVSFYFNSGN